MLCYSGKKLGETKTQRKGVGGRGSAVQPPNINLSISCCGYFFKKTFIKFCFTVLAVFMPETSKSLVALQVEQ